MARFPEDPEPVQTIDDKRRYMTRKTAPYAASYDRRAIRDPFGRFRISLLWPLEVWDVSTELQRFISRMAVGAGMTFSWLDPTGRFDAPGAPQGVWWDDLFVAIVTADKLIYDLPCGALPADLQLWANKATLIDPADYELSDNELAEPTDFATWTDVGPGPDDVTPGQVDPADPPGTDASLLEFTGTVYQGLSKAGSALTYGEYFDGSIWLRVGSGTLPITVWLFDDVGGATFKVVTLTTAWQEVELSFISTGVGTKRIQVGFTGDQTAGDFYAYRARLSPGYDGRRQVVFDEAEQQDPATAISMSATTRRLLHVSCESDETGQTIGVHYLRRAAQIDLIEQRRDQVDW